MNQEMMGWQWHQLDHMQIICTLFQTDNHASTSSLNFLQAGCSSWRATKSVEAPKAKYACIFNYVMHQNWNKNNGKRTNKEDKLVEGLRGGVVDLSAGRGEVGRDG